MADPAPAWIRVRSGQPRRHRLHGPRLRLVSMESQSPRGNGMGGSRNYRGMGSLRLLAGWRFARGARSEPLGVGRHHAPSGLAAMARWPTGRARTLELGPGHDSRRGRPPCRRALAIPRYELRPRPGWSLVAHRSSRTDWTHLGNAALGTLASDGQRSGLGRSHPLAPSSLGALDRKAQDLGRAAQQVRTPQPMSRSVKRLRVAWKCHR